MEVFLHNGDGFFTYSSGIRRYAVAGVTPAMVRDVARDVSKPQELGAVLVGGFDLVVDATTYVGLGAPFVLPVDLGAALYRAVPSAADVSADYLLQPGGGRNAAPSDSFVPGETDLWSIGYG